MWLLRPGDGSESHEPEEMMVRYYEREHFDPYARIKAEGLNQWSDLHEELAGYENFPNRPFLSWSARCRRTGVSALHCRL